MLAENTDGIEICLHVCVLGNISVVSRLCNKNNAEYETVRPNVIIERNIDTIMHYAIVLIYPFPGILR